MFKKIWNCFPFKRNVQTCSHIDNCPQCQEKLHSAISIRRGIPKKVREQVWKQYCGISNTGNCYCCGSIVKKYNYGWHCAHVIPHKDGGKSTIDNLRVCCSKCNLKMGARNLYDYKKTMAIKEKHSLTSLPKINDLD